jgi:hypothetical protein
VGAVAETVLLKARCADGHEWDVWGEESERPGQPAVAHRDLICPTCEPHGLGRAVELEYPETLS